MPVIDIGGELRSETEFDEVARRGGELRNVDGGGELRAATDVDDVDLASDGGELRVVVDGGGDCRAPSKDDDDDDDDIDIGGGELRNDDSVATRARAGGGAITSASTARCSAPVCDMYIASQATKPN